MFQSILDILETNKAQGHDLLSINPLVLSDLLDNLVTIRSALEYDNEFYKNSHCSEIYEGMPYINTVIGVISDHLYDEENKQKFAVICGLVDAKVHIQGNLAIRRSQVASLKALNDAIKFLKSGLVKK
jgi:hypothetical protein